VCCVYAVGSGYWGKGRLVCTSNGDDALLARIQRNCAAPIQRSKDKERFPSLKVAVRLMIEGNEYFRWIENYVSEEFQEALTVGRALLEENVIIQSPERLDHLLEIFRQGTILEAAFWQMGLSHASKPVLTQ